MAHILLVEDEDDIALALSIILRRRGHEITWAPTGDEGLRAIRATSPELVLLDIGLPDIDGWEVLAAIRAASSVPVLMLTAAGRTEDRVRGLLGGADDYLTKPFGSEVLAARVGRLLDRRLPPDQPDLVHGPVSLSARRHTVAVSGAEVALAPLEFRLLEALLRSPGISMTSHELLASVWGDEDGLGIDQVDETVSRLREAVGWGDDGPLSTAPGGGFLLAPPD